MYEKVFGDYDDNNIWNTTRYSFYVMRSEVRIEDLFTQ
jgi:hypothetical protein